VLELWAGRIINAAREGSCCNEGVPMASFKLRRFTNPDLLKTIAQGRLLEFLKPWRDYLSSRGLDFPVNGAGGVDCDALAHILIDPDATVPKDMIGALYCIDETASTEDMEALLDIAKSRGVDLEDDPGTTVADVAIQMWLAAPDILQEHHAETIAFRQKNFLYYGGTHGGKRTFPVVSDELRQRMEAMLDDWFEEHRRGRGCRIFLFAHEEKVWILIRHGMPMRREASHQEDGKSTTEFYRPEQHDVLIYDSSSDELAVHANTQGEIKLYLRCFGLHVFGDEGYFPPSDKFTLNPLIEDGANSLLCEDVDGLEEFRLIEYRRYWGGAYKDIEIRKSSDIFASLASRGQQLTAGGRLVSGTFKAKFADSPKERSVTIRPPRNAKYERNEDSELIDVLLAKRGFIVEPKVEGDDPEAPSAVLEVA
jgi:hypothetical protein